MGMQSIPKIKRALLVEQLMVKVDAELGQDIRMLKAQHGVDVPEMVRSYLRKELPKVKNKLSTA